MTKTIIAPSAAAPAVGPYNHAVRYGDLLVSSGQIPINPADPKAPLPEGIEAQTRRVLQNIEVILKDQSLDFSHVLKTYF